MSKTPITDKAMKWFENEMISNDIENHIKKTMARLETELNEAEADLSTMEEALFRFEAMLDEARLELSEMGGELSDTKNYLFEQRKLLEQALEALEGECGDCQKRYGLASKLAGCKSAGCEVIEAIQAIQDELGERENNNA